MRNLFWSLLVALCSGIPLILSSCVSNAGSLETRIEHKINTPKRDNVQMGPATYNQFNKEFEQPWPFGPYSTLLIVGKPTLSDQNWSTEFMDRLKENGITDIKTASGGF